MIEKRLRQEGVHHSSGHFTVDAPAAWKKMRAHLVHEPARYACHGAAAAVALGAKWLDVTLEPKLARLYLRGCRLDRSGLEQLLSNPLSHPLLLTLTSAQSYYGKNCKIRVVCEGGTCHIQGEVLRLETGGACHGLLIEILAGGSGFFSTARLDHTQARFHLTMECQEGILPIEVNGQSLTRPVPLGDNLLTVRLRYPGAALPDFLGRPVETREEDASGPFCGLIACLTHQQESVISNGRVLVRQSTPGFSTYFYLLESELDLSGELVGGGRELLRLARDRVRQGLLDWAVRGGVPERYEQRLHRFLAQWFEEEPEGALADALHFRLCSGESVALRALLGQPIYVGEGSVQGLVLQPDPLLLQLFPRAVRLPTLPPWVRVAVGPVEDSLAYDPEGEFVELRVSEAALLPEALRAAQVLPPGARWSTGRPGAGLDQQWLVLMLQAAGDARRLDEVLAYLGWLGTRFHAVVQRLLGLQMRMGGKIRLPGSALDAVLGKADEHSLAWLVDGGLLVGLGELESLEFLPVGSGGKVSLLQLQAASKVYINQAHSHSLWVPEKRAEALRQFVGAIRRGVVQE